MDLKTQKIIAQGDRGYIYNSIMCVGAVVGGDCDGDCVDARGSALHPQCARGQEPTPLRCRYDDTGGRNSALDTIDPQDFESYSPRDEDLVGSKHEDSMQRLRQRRRLEEMGLPVDEETYGTSKENPRGDQPEGLKTCARGRGARCRAATGRSRARARDA